MKTIFWVIKTLFRHVGIKGILVKSVGPLKLSVRIPFSGYHLHH